MKFRKLSIVFLTYCFSISAGYSKQAPQDKILFILLDGVQESLFSQLLSGNRLPHLKKLLGNHIDESTKKITRSGIYTAATSAWPSSSAVAYLPFVSGISPEKSGIVGVRQFQREKSIFRVYAGSDIKKSSEDLSKDYPLIYEVLNEGESFSQVGMITRRGWKKNGHVYRAINENFVSATGFLKQLQGDIKLSDFYNVVSYLNDVSPRKDRHRLDVFRVFKGRFFPWGLKASESFWNEKQKSVRLLKKMPKFSFISLHSPDHTAHKHGLKKDYIESIEAMDELIGAMLDVLRAQGVFENLTVIVTSDHGMSDVGPGPETHFDVAKALTRDTGTKIYTGIKRLSYAFNRGWNSASPILKHFCKSCNPSYWDGVYAVSGNANAQFYFKKPESHSWSPPPSYEELRHYPIRGINGTTPVFIDLVSKLLSYPEIDKIYLKGPQPMEYFIFNEASQALIEVRVQQGKRTYRYQVLKGEDPLGYDQNLRIARLIRAHQFLSGDEWALLTKNTAYPDALVQIVQLLNAKESGDIIIDAKKGYEPWDEMQQGIHGSLHRDHLVVPLIISSPRLSYKKARLTFKSNRMPRTVDLYPTMLQLLGLNPPNIIHWKRKGRVSSASVKTDIDGSHLNIWRP